MQDLNRTHEKMSGWFIDKKRGPPSQKSEMDQLKERIRNEKKADRVRQGYTIETKLRVLNQVNLGIKSQSEIAKELGLTTTTLNTWKRKQTQINKEARSGREVSRRRNRPGPNHVILERLNQWFNATMVNGTGARINGPELKEKANQIARELYKQTGDPLYRDFEATDSMITRMRYRYGIKQARATGEKNDADPQAVDEWMKTTMTEILQK